MDDQAFFTLGEAARTVGRSKPTLSEAIKNGRLSVYEKTPKGYRIAASELFRAFPPDEQEGPTPAPHAPNTGLTTEVAVLRERLTLVEGQHERERDILNRQIEDLRRRLDAEGEERRKLTAILTDQRATKAADQVPAAPAPAERPKGWRGLLLRLAG